MRSLFIETLQALLQPRRLGPILLVTAPMLFAQYVYAHGHLPTVLLAAMMCAIFIVLGPFSWRALFPPRPVHQRALRFAAYILAGAVPSAFGVGLPLWMRIGPSFVTSPLDLSIVTTLFWVGGWGLGRDIELELGLARERARADALRLEAERAQLLAVRAHLDPHFLFNTLNAIAEWCREDGETAERAVLQLSAILREVLGGITASSWPLERELDLARNVLALHHTRDPAWFTLSWRVPASLPPLQVPPMILLPLVENAVKHGPAKGYRGTLALAVELDAHQLRLEVSNPGPYGGPRTGSVGLVNLRRRVALAYGDHASFEIGPQDDERTLARLCLPLTPPR